MNENVLEPFNSSHVIYALVVRFNAEVTGR